MNSIITTDNIPLLDDVIHHLKKISTSCVLKDSNIANIYETLDIMKMSDRYISCIEGRVRFEMFNYTRPILEQALIPEYIIDSCIDDRNNIPLEKRDHVLDITRKRFISNYVEQNNYYRMLNGLPNYGDRGILIPDSILPNNLLDIIDTNKYIHEMSDNNIDILYSFGIIDKLLKLHPTCKYLNHMGSRRIPVYISRTSVNFALLYMDTDAPKEILSRFKEKYEVNRVYTLKTVYNDAFKLESDHFDNFIQVFILIQTMIDIISELPDMIIKREVFDIRMVQLIFKSNGVDFFPEIPLKYQIAMVRNLNRLIKYKSTTKNIIDICSLFGFDNIEVFKYYLLKDRKLNKDGDFEFNTIEDENGDIIEDLDKNYDLKFLKVPIDDIADNFLTDKSKMIDYDDIVNGDKYWNGDLPHDIVKTSILEKEFNYVQSKYLSVDTLYSMSDLTFQLVYFYNMIFDDVRVEELLKLKVPSINIYKEFKFVDIICFLYSLMYSYNNFEDDIMHDQTQIMHILGFNFKADIPKLGQYILDKGYTLEDLGVDGFIIPDTQILSYNQLLHVFTNNKKIHDHVIDQMYNADNKNIYDLYSTVYEALMVSELSTEFFRKSNGELAVSYTDYIKSRDVVLYDYLMTINNIESLDQRRIKINDLINDIIYIIEQHLETDDFNFIFSQLPSVSAESIKHYIYKVINFFKSYKVDIYSINTIYKFDDKLANRIKMIDKLLINYMYTKDTFIEVLSKIINNVTLEKQEAISLIDQLYIDITYWLDKLFNDDMTMRENISSMISVLSKNDVI
ncbi:MAG: hypothetical protein ACRCXT_08295, partial [Paraclostridium sp.]